MLSSVHSNVQLLYLLLFFAASSASPSSLLKVPIDLLRDVRDMVNATWDTSFHAVETIFTGASGRPRLITPKEQLHFLIEQGFRTPSIANGVSCRTVERRLQEFGVSSRSLYCTISDEQLDTVINGISINLLTV